VVGKAGDGFWRIGKARGSSGGRDITARGSHDSMRCVGGHVVVRVVVAGKGY
jgi:hypothetical protein